MLDEKALGACQKISTLPCGQVDIVIRLPCNKSVRVPITQGHRAAAHQKPYRECDEQPGTKSSTQSRSEFHVTYTLSCVPHRYAIEPAAFSHTPVQERHTLGVSRVCAGAGV